MKKIKIIIITFLFAFATTSYAEIYKNNSESGSSNQSFSLYGNSETSTTAETGSSGGLFRDSPAPGPGERPGSGGIGQDETPVGEGLDILVECCILFGIVGVIKERHIYKLVVDEFMGKEKKSLY